MKIRLGYVAISLTLSDLSYCKTITYTQYQTYNQSQQQLKLDHIMRNNLHNLKELLQFNILNEIHFFRFSHNLVPLATHPNVTFDYITPYQKEWKEIGHYIKQHNIRIDAHPDQFCILNSCKQDVVDHSIQILSFIYKLYQAMEINGKCVLHIGGGIDDKQQALIRFKKTFHSLPLPIQNMILLENDDRIFDIEDTLNLCEELKIPMVLDYHHYQCHHKKKNLDQLLPRICQTWNHTSLPPKMHFSSPKSQKMKRAHSDYIKYKDFQTFLTHLIPLKQDIDIMLECKAKEEALLRLSRQLQFYTTFHFQNQSTFYLSKPT